MDGYLLDLTHLDPFQKWSVVCAVALTILYAVMRPWRKRKDPLARPPMPLSAQREIEKQMTSLLVELEQMARQMSAQLDNKAAKLELLLKEADQKIATLQGACQGSSMAAEAPAADLLALPDPMHAEIYELADEGQSPRQIARRLGRHQGEIELILALRGHEQAAVAHPRN